jgi:hypothetical protein
MHKIRVLSGFTPKKGHFSGFFGGHGGKMLAGRNFSAPRLLVNRDNPNRRKNNENEESRRTLSG